MPDMPGDLKDGCWVQPTIWTGLPETATRRAARRSSARAATSSPSTPKTKCCAWPTTTATAWRPRSTRRTSAARTAWRSQIEVGLCWINSWFLRDLRTPFGGSKQSGIGREGGVHSLEFYTELRNVMDQVLRQT